MPRLEITLKGRLLREELLTAAVYYIGRDKGSDIVLSDPDVSRRHARLIVKDGKYWIEDLQSTHGVFLNGRKAFSEPLENGDRLQIASLLLRFSKDEDEITVHYRLGDQETLFDRNGSNTLSKEDYAIAVIDMAESHTVTGKRVAVGPTY